MCTGSCAIKWPNVSTEKLRDRDRRKNLLKNKAFLSMGALFSAITFPVFLSPMLKLTTRATCDLEVAAW
jgi:hypothetical protein